MIPVYAVARFNHKEIRNDGFHCYLNKLQKINSEDKGSLHQCLQGLFFALNDWKSVPVDVTDIA